ncbi:aromatic acid exporter family protein [Calidifontibacillus erzurumensis]|uniref:Aromatic acid exporter family protein n=1 Tax=Calidifontibacillus erzurumensis TaxID=2741433 RepID=A0A8J8GEP3_9BACI|nr:aromatic acid exporter family protein [Calidifontibacillus erzurumensis]NSL52124.1 aromatic acid exporter family protein [Calidifontibacillus erzurumensis]
MKLGARILKTGIAVTLALFLAKLLEMPSPSLSGIAAVFAIQPSIYRTYQSILEQVQGNVIGAAIAILSVITLGTDPFVIGIAVIIVIAIHLRLKIEGTIALSLVTVIAIMESVDGHFITFALDRFIAIMIGVLSSFLVNLLFIPPKYETKLYYKVVETTEGIVKWIRVSSRNATDHATLKEEIEKFKDKLERMENLYHFYKEERTYSKKKQFVKARKLVLFRQMIASTHLAFEILKKLHKLEHSYSDLPKSVQQMTKEILDSLTTYHEQILQKYISKAGAIPAEAITKDIIHEKEQIIEAYMEVIKSETEANKQDWIHTLPLLTTIIEYYEAIFHLDHLINSFQSYHTEENKVKISEKEEI